MSQSRPTLSQDEVKATFAKEFAPIKDKFLVHDLPLADAEHDSTPEVNSPGVYVHWHPQLGVVKVGKAQDNSKSRAFEHYRDGTKNQYCDMRTLRSDSNTRLILFNVRATSDVHWVLSVEAYLERALHPLIRAGRIG